VFPPDPGDANAGGPHAFKYGVTGHWVSGVEAVVAPGDAVRGEARPVGLPAA
jgi:FAD/FMN-containing dehydrogenase